MTVRYSYMMRFPRRQASGSFECCACLSLARMLLEADEAQTVGGEVVDQLDVQYAPGLNHLPRGLAVLLGGLGPRLGWLWQRIRPGQLRITAGRKISAVRSTKLLAVPW